MSEGKNESQGLNTVLRAENISKSYTTADSTFEVLKDLNLEIRGGELVALFGPSGSGKTTLLNLLAGLDKPDSGDVFVAQQNLFALSSDQRAMLRANKMGFVFQMSNLIGGMNVFENVKLATKIANRRVRDEEINRVLQIVGLSERQNSRPNQLSGGEQQRVAVARALINHPPILFADEPTGNVDSETSIIIMELMSDLVKREHLACLLVSHDVEWQKYADRVVFLRDGRLEERL